MKNKQTTIEADQHPYLRRLVAFLIDWYISSFLAMIPTLIFQSINGKDLVLLNRVDNLTPFQAAIATALALVIYTWYFCVFPIIPHSGFKTGQTFGRRILRVTVLKVDGSPLTFKDLFLRDFVGVLLLQGCLTNISFYLTSLLQMATGNAALLSYIQTAYYLIVSISLSLLFFTKRKQTLHDLLGHTRLTLVKDSVLEKADSERSKNTINQAEASASANK